MSERQSADYVPIEKRYKDGPRRGPCIKCGEVEGLGWAGTCAECWDAMPPTNEQAHDDWCAIGACPHVFGPLLIDGSESA